MKRVFHFGPHYAATRVLLLALFTLFLPVIHGCAQTSNTSGVSNVPGASAKSPPRVTHVIHISVDALGSKYLEKFLKESPAEFNHLARLVREGTSTLNARTDYSVTATLQNHACMITGRPVRTPAQWKECQGHFWEWNGNFPDPKAPASLHAVNPDKKYTFSVFDVAHDRGLKTALYASKAKFQAYVTSYGKQFGAQHARGRNKIDRVLIDWNHHKKTLADLKAHKPNYVFLHYAEPDGAGHAHGYLGSEYRDSVKKVNGYLGELLSLVTTDPQWKNRTVLILSADHGGEPGTKSHGNASHPHNYTIPFIVWGAGVTKGADLYKLNAATRTDPGDGRPQYAPTGQPIRNGDGGNLALKLLGLPAIPGSHINGKQDLKVR